MYYDAIYYTRTDQTFKTRTEWNNMEYTSIWVTWSSMFRAYRVYHNFGA